MNADTADIRLENSYARLPGHFYALVEPAPVPAPVLLAWNGPLAAELGLEELGGDEERLARLFGGNELPPGAEPIALAYAGHQFGRFVPQLGDGRAVLLGERVDISGRRRDIQLKGSGRTPFSRMGDGKSSLGPVIREYLVSEAMHTLGVPTTRALAAVATGERVFREEALPGGVFTRVAASHVRVGTFEYFAARGDADAVRTLADYAIDRHYPKVREEEEPLRAFYRGVVEAQARLVAHWMALGFIHGVMNTDNTAVSGETLDYGPCAFMDEFHYDKVFSSIDHYGRYAYGQQASIAQWNLARLADCLLSAGGDKAALEEELGRFPGLFEEEWLGRMARKLGLTTAGPDDADPSADLIADLVGDWLAHLQREGLDYTLSFRELAARAGASDEPRFGEFELRWRERLARQPGTADEVRASMEAENPLYIPRNHQVERAIRAAIGGDLSVFHELRGVLERPFEEQPGRSGYAEPPAPEERVVRTFCGT
ncbi:protein adenylyltransferase SelO [Lentisalinibacter orientalis]|uniref:protein adenylyltransferase SelO n=1 Tax=Lentisalinibacter orientalis TaxID=2992241 RepID=UPI0038683142